MDEWLPELEPPAGGLLRLRSQLDSRRRPWWIPAVVLVAVVLWMVVPPEDPSPFVAEWENDAVVWVPAAARTNIAITPVLQNDQVVMVRVASVTVEPWAN